MEGYFESYRYFDQYQEKIKQQFVPVDDFQNEFVKQARECNSVALHIRGGDFIQRFYHNFEYVVCKNPKIDSLTILNIYSSIHQFYDF